jgi:uncharacterized membrane protein YoaK (UPF0700 family)
MYQVPPPREPSGCIQTLVISRMILQILFIPLSLILGAILAVLLTLYAFSEHPLLGLVVIVGAAFLVVAAAKWEGRRIRKEFPEDEN